jgi:uncharacterized membrane protein
MLFFYFKIDILKMNLLLLKNILKNKKVIHSFAKKVLYLFLICEIIKLFEAIIF